MLNQDNTHVISVYVNTKDSHEELDIPFASFQIDNNRVVICDRDVDYVYITFEDLEAILEKWNEVKKTLDV